MKVGQIVRLVDNKGLAAPEGSTAKITELHSKNIDWIKLEWIYKGKSGQLDGFYNKGQFEVVSTTIEVLRADRIIDDLKIAEVTGEMMEYIIRKVGMEDQMLRQLIMSMPESQTQELLEERKTLNK